MHKLIPNEIIGRRILFIRGQRVMLDRDLALLYGVPTKALNQAVRRNLDRFPEDFMFGLSTRELDQLVTNCDRFSALKHSSVLPFAFTENGVAMLSSVLRSPRAVSMNIEIIRAFTRLRRLMATHKMLASKLDDLEKRIDSHDTQIGAILQAIRQLLEPPPKGGGKIGFRPGA